MDEIIIADIHASSDQAMHIDSGIRAKNQAIGIHQKYPAIGIDRPHDLARVLIENMIQHAGRRRRLNEVDLFIGLDVEAVPIQHQGIAMLVDLGGYRIGHGYITLPRNDPAILRRSP